MRHSHPLHTYPLQFPDSRVHLVVRSLHQVRPANNHVHFIHAGNLLSMMNRIDHAVVGTSQHDNQAQPCLYVHCSVVIERVRDVFGIPVNVLALPHLEVTDIDNLLVVIEHGDFSAPHYVVGYPDRLTALDEAGALPLFQLDFLKRYAAEIVLRVAGMVYELGPPYLGVGNDIYPTGSLLQEIGVPHRQAHPFQNLAQAARVVHVAMAQRNLIYSSQVYAHTIRVMDCRGTESGVKKEPESVSFYQIAPAPLPQQPQPLDGVLTQSCQPKLACIQHSHLLAQLSSRTGQGEPRAPP